MNIWIILSMCAAIFIGWALGPLIELLGQKIENSESAQRSAAKAKAESKYYDKTGISFYSPKKEETADIKYTIVIVVLFFIPLLLYLGTSNNIFAKISFFGLLLMFWKPLLSGAWGFIVGSKKK